MIFRGKQSFKERKFFCPFQTLIEKPSDFGKFFLSAISKLHIIHPEEPLWKFSWMFYEQLCQFWTFWKDNSDDFAKPHSIGPKLSPWRKKFIFSKKNSFFPTFLNLELNFFWLLAKKVAVWPNFRSLCLEERFEENKVFRKILFLFFRLRANKVRTMAIIFICVLITAYWLSRGTIFGTFFWSSRTHFVTSRLFGKKAGVCQNCILSSQRFVL